MVGLIVGLLDFVGLIVGVDDGIFTFALTSVEKNVGFELEN